MRSFAPELAPDELAAVDITTARIADIPVDATANYPAPRVEPLCYPGKAPEYSFMNVGDEVWPVSTMERTGKVYFSVMTPNEGAFDLDDVLRWYGLATMDERIPVVGFGSNACPGQLEHKFSQAEDKKGDIQNPADHEIVPTLKGVMKDVVAAYSSRIGIHGYVFAELLRRQGAESTVVVNFLSPDQLQRMIRSESAYHLCPMGEVLIDGMQSELPAFGFLGKNEIMLSAEGHPILLDSTTRTAAEDVVALSEEALLGMLAKEFGPQLDEVYPLAPVFVNSARNLMALVSYRVEFLRRQPKGATVYKNLLAPEDTPDPLIGDTLKALLRQAGRVSNEKLLDEVPAEQRDIIPPTFGELFAAVGSRA